MSKKTAVRYYSRSGNTKALAEAIAAAAGTKAVSVDEPEAKIQEKTDILFVGGALYAYGIDKNLQSFLDDLSKNEIEKAIIFSTSWISKHAVALIKANLQKKGILVEESFFYVRNKPDEKQLEEAKEFTRKMLSL